MSRPKNQKNTRGHWAQQLHVALTAPWPRDAHIFANKKNLQRKKTFSCRKAADVWEFQAKSGSSGFLLSFPLFPRENRSSRNVWENAWKSSRQPSSRHPRPSYLGSWAILTGNFIAEYHWHRNESEAKNMISELVAFRITKAKAKVKFGVKYLCGHECERSSVQLISIRKRKRKTIFGELISV